MQSCYSPKQLKAEKECIKILDIYRGIVSFFECSKCGECCRDGSPDLLHSDEYKNFEKDLLFWEDGLPGLKHPCPFFVNDSCEIHDTNIRPRICGAAPFGFTDDPQHPIVIKSCELGEQILEAYYVFMEETNEGDSDTIEDMLFPLTKTLQAKSFLNWLKKNENRTRPPDD